MRPKRLGFLAVAMSTELGGSGYEISMGPSWTFGWDICGYEKVVEGFGAYH